MGLIVSILTVACKKPLQYSRRNISLRAVNPFKISDTILFKRAPFWAICFSLFARAQKTFGRLVNSLNGVTTSRPLCFWGQNHGAH